jgi:hypothetical protein
MVLGLRLLVLLRALFTIWFVYGTSTLLLLPLSCRAAGVVDDDAIVDVGADLLFAQNLVNQLSSDDTTTRDAAVDVLLAMELDKPYHKQIRTLFDQTDIHQVLLADIQKSSQPQALYKSFRLVKDLALLDNELGGRFSMKCHQVGIEQIILDKFDLADVREGHPSLLLLIVNAFAAMSQVYETIDGMAFIRMVYLPSHVLDFLLRQLDMYRNCQDCIYEILKCLCWGLNSSRFVQKIDMVELLVSVGMQHHTEEQREGGDGDDKIQIQILEILYKLIEKSNHKTNFYQRLRESDGWLYVARLKHKYELTHTVGCPDNFRYRHELADRLLQGLLPSNTPPYNSRVITKPKKPATKKADGVCNRFSAIRGDELEYEPMGPNGPYEINNQYLVASMHVTSPYNMLDRIILSQADAALKVLKGLDMSTNLLLRQKMQKTAATTNLFQVFATILQKQESAQQVHDVIIIVEELTGPPAPPQDNSFAKRLDKAGIAKLIVHNIDWEDGATIPDKFLPILTHGLVVIANILSLSRDSSSRSQGQNDSDFDSDDESPSSKPEDSSFLRELTYSLHRFLYLYDHCEACLFATMYCLRQVLELAHDDLELRRSAVKAGIVERVLELAVKYLEESEHVFATSFIETRPITTHALMITILLLVPLDAASFEAKSALQSSSRSWRDIIQLHQTATQAEPPRWLDMQYADLILKHVFRSLIDQPVPLGTLTTDAAGQLNDFGHVGDTLEATSTDQDMPDVSDPDAGFVPTEDQPYRRLRRHTIT